MAVGKQAYCCRNNFPIFIQRKFPLQVKAARLMRFIIDFYSYHIRIPIILFSLSPYGADMQYRTGGPENSLKRIPKVKAMVGKIIRIPPPYFEIIFIHISMVILPKAIR